MAKHPPPAPPAKVEPKAPQAASSTPEPNTAPNLSPGTEGPKPTPKGKVKGVPALSIRSVPQGGFCRAGRRWVPSPQIVPVSDFTEDQVAALRAESNLVVEDTEIAPEPEA